MLRSWFVFPLACLVATAIASAEEGAKFNGTWKPIEAEVSGQKLPDEVIKAMQLTMTDGKYTVAVGEKLDTGTYKVDAKAKPATIDITGVEGPNKGKTLLAICELDGDTLRVCYDLTGQKRPEEFKTEKGKALFLIKYKRESK